MWHCNCPDRKPANKFQCKNHGTNHGRYFYTCENKKCDFFLWASDAELREKATVLSNSRSESDPATTQTPTKRPRVFNGLLTPQTEPRFHRRSPATGGGQQKQQQQQQLSHMFPRSAKARMMSEDIDEFEWDDDVGAEVGKLLDAKPIRQPNFGPPKAHQGPAPRAHQPPLSLTSPMKRKWSDTEDDHESKLGRHTSTASFAQVTSRSYTDRVPSFSSATAAPPSSMEISMSPTPTRFRDAMAGGDETPLDASQLASQAVRILESHGVALPKQAQDELMSLLDKYDLKMMGIIRGRDISRVALKKKDEQIEQLNARLAKLEGRS
ncbi:uncharacterized protein BO72DRAFT_446868 [Aspergillus fijiensis CBS 313.89]|uniref:GRF-type domain-containing protein n=1 Tax=Aspergillus fijiensis CBS 313.89 TaxID=1448319 RepID=A0A8G1RST8_9EURO|nr:uncharacterized protein BO72DRAFT_446868 [Aspergillus fijiensis CBS 313.89]RAK78654.1 hypothetical protein BO72DRAFT_446868 [Aspergillus fijiensis CBS 313.89]